MRSPSSLQEQSQRLISGLRWLGIRYDYKSKTMELVLHWSIKSRFLELLNDYIVLKLIPLPVLGLRSYGKVFKD